EPELARCGGRLAEAFDRGEPRIWVMTGEAGLGKPRFAAEVERFAAGYPVGGFTPLAGARVLSVHCAAFGEHRRLAPLADLVRAAIGVPADVIAPPEPGEERLRRPAPRLRRRAPRPAPGAQAPPV